ncbi:MAG: type II toxin-antitoxin system RelE/ParE family toxin [Fibrobacteres bacterium]|nr:type II toxin-antitoxin system RelE/ParE family toxin [Fibrobacterota bacterium]
MVYKVEFIEDAENDLEDIFKFYKYNASENKALTILRELLTTCETLSKFPERGVLPPELLEFGILEYSEVHCKPYRIIYQTIDKTVYVHCILHMKRSIVDILEKRLLR